MTVEEPQTRLHFCSVAGSSTAVSNVLAISIGLALCAAVLAPLVWVALRGHGRAIGAVYLAVILAVAVFQTGIFQRGSLAPTNMIVASMSSTDEAQCREILDMFQQAGLTIDRSNPDSPRIVGKGADQLPLEVSQIVLSCDENQNATTEPAQTPGGDFSKQ